MTLRGFLRSKLGFSRRLLRRLKAREAVLINGRPVRLNYRVQRGDELTLLPVEEPAQGATESTMIKPWILWEDREILVLNKPAGLIVHPTGSHRFGTLLQHLESYFQAQGVPGRPHLVNRLDRDTSGVILIAKHPWAHHRLAQALEENLVRRTYLAFVVGRWPEKEIRIDLPIRRVGPASTKREIHPEGQRAVTMGRTLKTWSDLSLVELELLTGRTHQIRVHLQALGTPLAGDILYGGGQQFIARQALHAFQLEFPHPVSGEEIRVRARLPADMVALLRKLEQQGGSSFENRSD
ncbi:MAG: RluA family pseudouridine synthase [Limnochordia bacterium]|jgi:23S rRNA pseudouridine1911/1915/1917 synthase